MRRVRAFLSRFPVIVKRLRMRYLVLLFLPCLLYSCRQKPEPFNAEQKQNIVNDVKAMLTAYGDDVRKNGLAAEINYFDTSADFFWMPAGFSSAMPYDSVCAILRGSSGMFAKVDNRWDNLKVVPLATHWAVYTGKLTSSVADTFGNTATLQMWETGTVIKRADGWKLLCGQTTALN